MGQRAVRSPTRLCDPAWAGGDLAVAVPPDPTLYRAHETYYNTWDRGEPGLR